MTETDKKSPNTPKLTGSGVGRRLGVTVASNGIDLAIGEDDSRFSSPAPTAMT
jgi:hypothetical protein